MLNDNICQIVNSIHNAINEYIRKFIEQSYFKCNQLAYSVIQDCSDALLMTHYNYDGSFGCCFTNKLTDCVQVQFTSKSSTDRLLNQTFSGYNPPKLTCLDSILFVFVCIHATCQF